MAGLAVRKISAFDEIATTAIADVRRYPGSRKFPHFNRSELQKLLADSGIRYEWFENLGGRRHGKPCDDSPNGADVRRGVVLEMPPTA
ncbi:MAG: DUF488 family protein, partial [Phycisphaerae bacterium]